MSTLFVLAERPSVYLASKSSRRQELLRQLGVDFTQLLMREAAGRRRDVVVRVFIHWTTSTAIASADG